MYKYLLILMVALLSCSVTNARTDFTGKWENAEMNYDMRYDAYAKEADYTPEAWANIQNYFKYWDHQGVDDPAKFCVNYGMPRIMGTARNYVIDITQTDNRLVVIVEYMDSFRNIHLDKTEVPDSVAPSNNGFSIARWEGDTLVIETTELKERTIGKFQRSEESHITERWTIGEDPEFGKVLMIDAIVDDPVVFRKPFKIAQKYKLAPEGIELNEYGCADAKWDDYVDRKLDEIAAKEK